MFAASKTDSASTGGYQISRSLRFNSADNTYLNRTPASAGNRQIWTLSFWIKRTTLSTRQEILGNADSSALNGLYVEFLSDDTLQIGEYGTSSWNWQFQTYPVYRDPSAWYHIVISVDTTQATNTNRVKIYVNNTQITVFNNTVYPSLNFNCAWNTTQPSSIGRNGAYTALYGNAYLTEIYNIDGQALTPSSFGETNAQTGVWQPKAYSGSYGTNGFYLNFSDNSNTTAATLGKDYSGNGNNWTPNNFSVTAGAGNDSLVDSPTSYGTDTGVGGTVRGNYATLNPLVFTNGYATLSNGNLDVVPDSTHYPMVPATFGMSSGKWYWEYTLGASGNGGRLLGIATSAASNTTYLGGTSSGWGYYGGNGDKYTNNSGSAYGSSYTNGDVIGVAFDADAGTLVFYKNGTSQGTAFSSLTSGPYFPAWSAGDAGQTGTTSLNFGQRPFAYTAPSGFKALCTQNLPVPSIGATTATLAGKFFNAVTYSGNNAGQTISVGFQPDLTWIKLRSISGDNEVFDVLRSYKDLSTNSTAAEPVNYNGTGLTAFTSNGFTLAVDQTIGNVNYQPATYVAWNWKANGAGSTNTAGTVTSTVSANTTSGFSVVTWTGSSAGQTVGHGLGVAPSLIIAKTRSATGENWPVYHKDLGIGAYLFLSSTASSNTTYPTYWGSSAPTSTVFGTFTGGYPSANNYGSMVAYCFAEVAGYSKFGSYTGNGNTNRNFVYLGFTPALILVKRTSSSGTNWRMVRPRSVYLSANTADAEYASYPGPFLQTANGFEISGGDDVNENGGTFIYAAFASVPFKFSLAQ